MINEIGSLGWFKDRAIKSITPINPSPFPEVRTWDFSDSACLYSPGAENIYGGIQSDADEVYRREVTEPESKFLYSIYTETVARLPQNIAYIDLGPGTEGKEEKMIQQILDTGKDVVYLPVDVNNGMLVETSDRIKKKFGITVVPIRSTFEDINWNRLSNEKLELSTRTAFASLGLTFTNYEPVRCVRMLQKIAGSDGISFITSQLRDGNNLETLKGTYRSETAQRLFKWKLKLIDIQDGDIGEQVLSDEILVYYPLKKVPPVIAEKGGNIGDMVFIHSARRYWLDDLTQTLASISEQYQMLNDKERPAFAAILLSRKENI